VDGGALPHPRGGQYLTLRIPGAGQPAPIRTYSLSSPPSADSWRISVKREPHGYASAYLTSSLRPGEILAAAAPRGEFVLDSGTGPVVLVSAGIGITPVLAMLHELAAHRNARSVWWLHSARGPLEQPLAAEGRALIAALPQASEYLTYTAATPAQRRDAHAGAGRLNAETLAALGIPAGCDAYICGPQSFMDGMESALAAVGLDPAHIHTERFGALASTNPGIVGHGQARPHQPPGPPATGPSVTFARSGITTAMPDDGRTVLELAEACDVPTRWSCRTGVCHTCITPILSGEVGYSPAPVDEPVEGEVLICCSRPRTDIVLDM
jgi:ferredoxin-NADP reductase